MLLKVSNGFSEVKDFKNRFMLIKYINIMQKQTSNMNYHDDLNINNVVFKDIHTNMPFWDFKYAGIIVNVTVSFRIWNSYFIGIYFE